MRPDSCCGTGRRRHPEHLLGTCAQPTRDVVHAAEAEALRSPGCSSGCGFKWVGAPPDLRRPRAAGSRVSGMTMQIPPRRSRHPVIPRRRACCRRGPNCCRISSDGVPKRFVDLLEMIDVARTRDRARLYARPFDLAREVRVPRSPLLRRQSSVADICGSLSSDAP